FLDLSLAPQPPHSLPTRRSSDLAEPLRAGQRAGCSQRITPHRLRHTYASEMVRLGVSLPAVMQLLGHKDIRMTMRYVQVTQVDLDRKSTRLNSSHQIISYAVFCL